MATNKILPYNKNLKPLARELRKNMTKGEILLWQQIRKRQLGVQFHRQIPIDEYIVDFYCHELLLAIEVDGECHYRPGAYEEDKKREDRLKSLGVHIVRIHDSEVKKDMPNVIRTLEAKIAELS
jgi:very-short-patch-repair endonuclease